MGLMDFLDKAYNKMVEYSESDSYKRLVAKAEQMKAQEIARTTGINGLKCKIDRVYDNYGAAVYCEGEVHNIGKSTYKSVTVNVTFKNQDGKTVDKQTTSVISYGSTLCPGESVPFKVLSSARNIKSANVSILDFQEI